MRCPVCGSKNFQTEYGTEYTREYKNGKLINFNSRASIRNLFCFECEERSDISSGIELTKALSKRPLREIEIEESKRKGLCQFCLEPLEKDGKCAFTTCRRKLKSAMEAK